MRVFRKWLLWEGHVRERQQPSQHQGRLQSSDDLPSVAVPLPLCCGSPIARAKEERETIQLRESSLERVFRKSKGEQAHTPKPSFLRRHNKQRKPSLPLTMISVNEAGAALLSDVRCVRAPRRVGRQLVDSRGPLGSFLRAIWHFRFWQFRFSPPFIFFVVRRKTGLRQGYSECETLLNH